jgi:hypothetical protein
MMIASPNAVAVRPVARRVDLVEAFLQREHASSLRCRSARRSEGSRR